jgi:hypothetical protein
LQAGSSYDIPKLTQQTFGRLRAADEIIDEGHFIGKALGEVSLALFASRGVSIPARIIYPEVKYLVLACVRLASNTNQ